MYCTNIAITKLSANRLIPRYHCSLVLLFICSKPQTEEGLARSYLDTTPLKCFRHIINTLSIKESDGQQNQKSWQKENWEIKGFLYWSHSRENFQSGIPLSDTQKTKWSQLQVNHRSTVKTHQTAGKALCSCQREHRCWRALLSKQQPHMQSLNFS